MRLVQVAQRATDLLVQPWLAALAPLVWLGLSLRALQVWHRASRGYQSAGT